MTPSTQKQWTVTVGGGFEGLNLDTNAPVPTPGNREVLVKCMYRERSGTVSCRDGWIPGCRVATLFNQLHTGGLLTPQAKASGVGGVVDGALREYGVYAEQGLVHIPQNLSMVEASTLSCAALTAWNALYGLEGRSLKAGMWV